MVWRFDDATAQQWWGGMNLSLRSHIIKQLQFKDRTDFSWKGLAQWERRMVEQRFEDTRKRLRKLDQA